MTIHSIESLLKTATQRLLSLSDSAQLDAEVLLCHVLKKPHSYLRTWPEKTLTVQQYQVFQSLLQQRQQGQPIAYLTGVREFWSRDFIVTPDVLIPRPDTETLIEVCLELIKHQPQGNLIDLGTGSGAIAVTLAAEQPSLNITAVDNSLAALNIAKKNASQHQTAINFIHSNWFEKLATRSFDFIVSNPPYIDPADPHLLQGDVRFEPDSALSAPQQGLQDIMLIAENSQQHLVSQGYLILEHGYDQQVAVAKILQQYAYQNIHCVHDLAGHPRVSYAQKL